MDVDVFFEQHLLQKMLPQLRQWCCIKQQAVLLGYIGAARQLNVVRLPSGW
jgi:hypothetical protein